MLWRRWQWVELHSNAMRRVCFTNNRGWWLPQCGHSRVHACYPVTVLFSSCYHIITVQMSSSQTKTSEIHKVYHIQNVDRLNRNRLVFLDTVVLQTEVKCRKFSSFHDPTQYSKYLILKCLAQLEIRRKYFVQVDKGLIMIRLNVICGWNTAAFNPERVLVKGFKLMFQMCQTCTVAKMLRPDFITVNFSYTNTFLNA